MSMASTAHKRPPAGRPRSARVRHGENLGSRWDGRIELSSAARGRVTGAFCPHAGVEQLRMATSHFRRHEWFENPATLDPALARRLLYKCKDLGHGIAGAHLCIAIEPERVAELGCLLELQKGGAETAERCQ